MPSNLSADERAAVEKVRDALDRKDLSDKELVVFDDEPLYPGSLFKPGEPVTYGDLRTLLAVVARAGEPVADASKNIAIANRLTVFARELGRDHPRYITLLNAAIALEMSAYAHPADARDRGDASEAVMHAIAETVTRCAGLVMAKVPTEEWCINYAEILRTAIDHAMHAAPAAPEDK